MYRVKFHSMSKQGTVSHFCSIQFTFVRNPHLPCHAGNLVYRHMNNSWHYIYRLSTDVKNYITGSFHFQNTTPTQSCSSKYRQIFSSHPYGVCSSWQSTHRVLLRRWWHPYLFPLCHCWPSQKPRYYTYGGKGMSAVICSWISQLSLLFYDSLLPARRHKFSVKRQHRFISIIPHRFSPERDLKMSNLRPSMFVSV